MTDEDITFIVGWPTEPEMVKFRKVAAAAEARERERCAAPDLLEALQRALNVLDATGAQEDANAARAAIAKATGAHDKPSDMP